MDSSILINKFLSEYKNKQFILSYLNLNVKESLPYYFYKLFLNASTDKYFSPPSGKTVTTFFPFPSFLATS